MQIKRKERPAIVPAIASLWASHAQIITYIHSVCFGLPGHLHIHAQYTHTSRGYLPKTFHGLVWFGSVWLGLVWLDTHCHLKLCFSASLLPSHAPLDM